MTDEIGKEKLCSRQSSALHVHFDVGKWNFASPNGPIASQKDIIESSGYLCQLLRRISAKIGWCFSLAEYVIYRWVHPEVTASFWQGS